MECTCEICQGYCQNRPGRYAPGEAEKTAKSMGMTLQEFFNKYLVYDIWDGFGPNDDVVAYLLPVYQQSEVVTAIYNQIGIPIDELKPGGYVGNELHGTCVFFKNGRCSIHATKPQECRNVDHNSVRGEHVRVTELWNKPEHQLQIQQLVKGVYDKQS